MSVINNWIEKNKNKAKDLNELNHVHDFLEKKYKNKKSINFSYKEAVLKATKWTTDLNNKNKTKLKQGLSKDILKFESGMKIVNLLDKDSKNWEGYWMKHCVSSYEDHSGIFSLRDLNNYPHCTIEINENKVVQIKGKANSIVKSKYSKYIIDFLKFINLEVPTQEIINIGLFPLNNDLINVLNYHFNNLKIETINKKDFLEINEFCLIKCFEDKIRNLSYFELLKILSKNNKNIYLFKDLLNKFDFYSRKEVEDLLYNIIIRSSNEEAAKITMLFLKQKYGLNIDCDKELIYDLTYVNIVHQKSEFIQYLLNNFSNFLIRNDKTRMFLLLNLFRFDYNKSLKDKNKIIEKLKNSINDKSFDPLFLKIK